MFKDWWGEQKASIGGNLAAAAIVSPVVYLFWTAYERVPTNWRILYAISAVTVILACFWWLFIRPPKRMPAPIPPSEDDAFPLSSQAEHIMSIVVKDEYLRLAVVQGMGQKGAGVYSGSVELCDGNDAKQSARYEAGIGELIDAGYLRQTGNETYKMTASGTLRAERILEKRGLA